MGIKGILFDFDGTLTTQDSMLDFVAFHFGKSAMRKSLMRLAPRIVGMKTRLTTPQKVKERMLKQFFFEKSREEMLALGAEYATSKSRRACKAEVSGGRLVCGWIRSLVGGSRASQRRIHTYSQHQTGGSSRWLEYGQAYSVNTRKTAAPQFPSSLLLELLVKVLLIVDKTRQD